MRTTLRISCNPLLLFLCSFSIGTLVFVSKAHAQLVNGRFITSVYAFEKFDSVDASDTHVRGFQSAFLDISHGSFSLHAHMQIASVLESTLDEEPDFRTYYLYAKIRDIGEILDVSAGRIPYYAGVGSGLVDGSVLTARFDKNNYRVTFYAGARVPEELTLNGWNSLNKNFTVGGQFLIMSIPNTRIGASYVNKQRDRVPYWTVRPDSLFNPVSIYIIPNALKEQLISGDVRYDFSDAAVYSRYDFDLNRSATQRFQIGGRIELGKEWYLSGDLIHREPRVAYNSFFSAFVGSAVDEFEVGGDYRFLPSWRAFLRGAYVSYDGEDSFRYTIGLAQTYAGFTYRGNSGYAGELNSLSVQGSFPLFDRLVVPNAALTVGSYKLNDEAPRETALAFAFGSTVRPFQVLSFDVQVQVLTNRVVDNDVRLFGKLNYWFARNLSVME
jgi:hypothetical protein